MNPLGAIRRSLAATPLLLLALFVHARALRAQDAAEDSSRTGNSDVTEQVLACAREVALGAGFETELSVFGTVLHAWRPHLQSMDTNEMDYVRVRVYGRGTAKGFRWEVEAHTVTGRAFISTSVYSPRPPSRDAGALRRRIMQDCKPETSGS
jgi:hypothetical protein